MADDSISIFEHPTDGFSGGKFLERGPVPKAGAPLGVNLTDKDLFVGAKLLPYNHAFELHRSGGLTLRPYFSSCQRQAMLSSSGCSVDVGISSRRSGADSALDVLV